MIKRICAIIVIAVFTMVAMVGCGENNVIPYNAVIYDNVVESVNAQFIADNRTWGAFYDDGVQEELVQVDASHPETRTYIVFTEKQKNEIFNENFNIEIDFENDMLVVHTFTTVYHRQINLVDIAENDGILKIKYATKRPPPNVGDASMPYQRWIVVKLDKLDITSVDIEEK